ncbi:MAG: hypothetical protein DRH04_04495 [Deltaproteobacteria bacterium]|nr:MAG: hypothetical protein DRH04_04495 [Deltaproteobacteria bacterium]
MTKKFFSALLIAVFMVAMAGAAWAGTLAVNVITVASEGGAVLTANDYDLDSDVNSPLGNGTGTAIVYTPGVSFNAGDTIRFNLSNATFRNSTLFLAVDESQAEVGDIDGDGTGTEYQIVGQESNRASDGSWVEMTVVAVGGATWQPGWDISLISSNADADQGDDPVVGLDDDAYDYNLDIRPTSSTSDVYIWVNNATYTGGNASSVRLLDFRTQFSASLTRPANSTIDVNNNRTRFVEEGGANDVLTSTNDTDIYASAARVTISSDGTLDDAITLGASDAYTMTLSSSSTAGVALTGPSFYETSDNEMTDGADIDFIAGPGANEITLSIPGNTTNFQNPGDSNSDDLVIGVNGATALVTRTFSLAVALNFNTSGYTNRTWNLGTSHTWTINGMQARVPYMALNVPGYLSFLKVSNNSSMTGEVTVDAVIWDVTTDVTSTQDDVAVKNVSADRVATISEAELLTALGLAGTTDMYHVNLLITVTAPADQVHISAFQKDPVGRTAIPVYYDTNVRTWLQ